MSIFDPQAAYERYKARLIEQADHDNAEAVGKYYRDYSNAKKNWLEKGKQFPFDPPARLVTVEVDDGKRTTSITVTDQPVCEALPFPWDEAQPEQPLPEFGAEIMPGVYAGFGSTAAKGTVKKGPDGRDYQLVVIGSPGQIWYQKLWVLVGQGL